MRVHRLDTKARMCLDSFGTNIRNIIKFESIIAKRGIIYMEGRSFPLIWKEPDPSAWIEDVSGVVLRHITLLCRDMICECNKCTTGCPESFGSKCCDACKMAVFERFHQSIFGSFAEGCMLPTFFVPHNELNKGIKKCSDIDVMHVVKRRVGFNTKIESNIFATIETDNCRPGYLRLKVAENGKTFRLSENIESLDANHTFRINNRKIEDSFSSLYDKTITNGPATTRIFMSSKTPNIDEVYCFNCSSWPPVAQTWVDRERRSKWPSKEIIRYIVSKGCHIVHKAHPSSRDSDAEFRFSFSEAELILFNSLAVNQKKCFIAFKALVKYGVYRSEFKAKKDIDLSSYIMKTIFLWSCETIPADQWQTTNGWARCLLYMIDQLHACLKSRTLPGYFIPECNLMDSIEIPQTLSQEIVKLRSNPMTYAARFLDSTRCFRRSYFKICEHIQNFCESYSIKEIVLQRQLLFLQRMMIELDSNRGVKLWQREAVLRIFAKWCHQNSHEIHLTPLQCLTKEMTLFDVVHLDIVHGFDVPNHVLLEYVDREWSVDVVCKLACWYSMTTLKRLDHKNNFEYSLNFKTLLMIHQAMNHKYPSSETIITSVFLLMLCKEYEMAAHVLEPAFRECFFEIRYIHCSELFADIFSHKMRNEFQEFFDIRKFRSVGNEMFQTTSDLVRFSMSVCYKYIGDDEKRDSMLTIMKFYIVSSIILDNLHGDRALDYSYVLLMLEVFENSEKWRNLYYQIYERFMSMKLKMIKHESENVKDGYKTQIYEDTGSDRVIPCRNVLFLCSCTIGMMGNLMAFLNYHRALDGFSVEILDSLKHFLGRSISKTADRLYFSQCLISRKIPEQALPLLEATVKQEGDFSTSVVIWPKQLYESCLNDDNLRRELIKSSEDYVVFPANLYARYLLSIAYSSLGQEENHSNNQAELIVLRDRYSKIRELAPMLKIISAVS